MENLVRPQIDTIHQADAIRRDQAFEKDVQLDPQRIRILRRPQATYITPPAPQTQEVDSDLPKSPVENLGPTQPQWKARNIGRHTKLIDRKDNLRKMERELRKTMNPIPQNTAQ
jgi:hypothetical protein